MTAGELIYILRDLPAGTPVYVPSGDGDIDELTDVQVRDSGPEFLYQWRYSVVLR